MAITMKEDKFVAGGQPVEKMDYQARKITASFTAERLVDDTVVVGRPVEFDATRAILCLAVDKIAKIAAACADSDELAYLAPKDWVKEAEESGEHIKIAVAGEEVLKFFAEDTPEAIDEEMLAKAREAFGLPSEQKYRVRVLRVETFETWYDVSAKSSTEAREIARELADQDGDEGDLIDSSTDVDEVQLSEAGDSDDDGGNDNGGKDEDESANYERPRG